MATLRQLSAFTLLVSLFIAAVNAQVAPLAKGAIPKTITVKEVLAIIGKTEVTGQGCGGGDWNGEIWGFYLNSYKPMKLPWDSEPQLVKARFVYHGMPDEHHLIEFSGAGFRYRRSTDDPKLTLDEPAK